MNMMQRLRARVKGTRGQNTVEYLLMLGAIVGFVLIIGGLIKKQMPGIWNQIAGMISGAASNLGQGGS